jgi:hypothetical protein
MRTGPILDLPKKLQQADQCRKSGAMPRWLHYHDWAVCTIGMNGGRLHKTTRYI